MTRSLDLSENSHVDDKPKNSIDKRQMIGIAFELGFIIALPVIFFGFFGKWLDQKTGTYPMLTMVGILTAIAFTSIWIYRKFRDYFKRQ